MKFNENFHFIFNPYHKGLKNEKKLKKTCYHDFFIKNLKKFC